jgi:hypothetical protein
MRLGEGFQLLAVGCEPIAGLNKGSGAIQFVQQEPAERWWLEAESCFSVPERKKRESKCLKYL